MKKIIIGIVVVLLVALAVPVAYAAVSTDKQKEIDGLNKQIFDLRKQAIDKYVEGGQITPDQGKLAKDRMDQAEKYWQENAAQVRPGLGRGACGGPGTGLCGGSGVGCGLGAGYGLRGGVAPNNY